MPDNSLKEGLKNRPRGEAAWQVFEWESMNLRRDLPETQNPKKLPIHILLPPFPSTITCAGTKTQMVPRPARNCHMLLAPTLRPVVKAMINLLVKWPRSEGEEKKKERFPQSLSGVPAPSASKYIICRCVPMTVKTGMRLKAFFIFGLVPLHSGLFSN